METGFFYRDTTNLHIISAPMFTRAWPKSVFFPKIFFSKNITALSPKKGHNRLNWAQNDTIKTKRWSFSVKYESCVCWSICLLIILQNKICKKICIHIKGLKWCKLVKIAAKRDFKGENYYSTGSSIRIGKK